MQALFQSTQHLYEKREGSGSIPLTNGSGSGRPKNIRIPWIRIPNTYDQCCGSGMLIPDPTFFHPGSELSHPRSPDPGSSSKNLSILTPKKAKKWFLSSKKYDPGCSSRIPDPDADFLPSRIPDPGVKKHPIPDPGSRIRIRNTGATFLEHLAVYQDEEEEERTWTSDSEADSTPSRTENDFTSDSE